jgi:TatD DNase family protein
MESIKNGDLNGIVDTHAHLSYLDERGIGALQCVGDLFEAGFWGILDVGNKAGDLTDRIRAFGAFKKVRFCAGVWPEAGAIADRVRQIDILQREIDANPKDRIAAIGECGFDRRETPEGGAAEREFFEMQLDLARRLGLPVIVHTREAASDALESLAGFKDVRAVIHCFSYGPEDAKKFLDLGCYISFAGNLTFKNAGLLREAIKAVPLDRLLLETDSPFLAPVPYRGKPAQPGFVVETYKTAAEVLRVDIEDLKTRIIENAGRLGFCV